MNSNNLVVFDEKSHTYTHTEYGKLISVTTLLGKYKKPFDSHTHAARVAKREGVHINVVLEMWEAGKNKACDKGTKIHKLLEDYITGGVVVDRFDWMYESYNKSVDEHVSKYKGVLCEQLFYNEDYRVAGLADLLYDHGGNEFTIGDFKTNKRFRFNSQYSERLLFPVDHLHSCEFNSYALQLSMYAYMYEQMTGKKCRGCVIFYLNGRSFDTYHCNYLKSDVEKILKHYYEGLNRLK